MRLLFFLLALAFVGCTSSPEVEKPAKKPMLDSTGTGVKEIKRADGSMRSKIPYLNGEKQGVGYQYYKNGKVQLQISYANGKKHGLEYYNYESGKPYRISNWNNGELDSTQVYYHKNGQLMAEVPWNNGMLCLGTKEYSSKGKLYSTGDILVKETDLVAMTGEYKFELSTNRRYRTIEYFVVEEEEAKKKCPNMYFSIPDVKGKFEHSIQVQQGTFVMRELYFGATCESFKRIPHKIIKRVAISVTNR